MKRVILISSLLCAVNSLLLSQTPHLTVEGILRVIDVPASSQADSVLTRQADGTITQMPIESINNRDAGACSLGYHVLPADFDFQNIPSNMSSSIWEIRHCHDLQNNTVTLPSHVILTFKGGQLKNYSNIIGDQTGIDAQSTQIFDGAALSGSWTLEYVNVCWFGAKADPLINSSPAFTKATSFLTNQQIRRLLIPSGNYHLEEFWKITGAAGAWNPTLIDGYGAVLDNTVCVAMFSVSLKGLVVDGAERHGFVFLRGQGAHHEHLLARNCGLDGFYCGIDAGGNDYGANFQVTRCVFSGLVSLQNGRHGWLMEGNSTANRSWFNANSVISYGAVSNAEKGFTWIGGTGPNGVSQMNYNTYMNMNCEGNGDISVDLPESKSSTFIGGHFVDKDIDGFAFRSPGGFNVNFGGRYVGEVERSSFTYVNTDLKGEGGIIGRFEGVDDIQTKDLTVSNELTVSQEPFMPLAWSIFPKSHEVDIIAADNKTNHQFTLDLQDMPSADALVMRISRFGKRNLSGGYQQKYAYSVLANITKDTAGNYHLDWNKLNDEQNCTINTVTINPAGIVTIDFNTTYLMLGSGFGVTEYQDTRDTDFR